jgi:hypothetical protein
VYLYFPEGFLVYFRVAFRGGRGGVLANVPYFARHNVKVKYLFSPTATYNNIDKDNMFIYSVDVMICELQWFGGWEGGGGCCQSGYTKQKNTLFTHGAHLDLVLRCA